MVTHSPAVGACGDAQRHRMLVVTCRRAAAAASLPAHEAQEACVHNWPGAQQAADQVLCSAVCVHADLLQARARPWRRMSPAGSASRGEEKSACRRRRSRSSRRSAT